MAKKEESKKTEEKVVENPFENFSILNGPTVESLSKNKEESAEEEKEPEIEKTKITPKAEEKPKKEELEEELALIEEEQKYFDKNGKKIEPTKTEKEKTVEKEESEEETSEEFSYKPLVDHLASKNILDIPEDKEFEDTEEYLETLVDNTATKRAIEKYNNFYDNLPEDGKQLLDFMSKGGDPKEFMNLYYNQGSYQDIKLDNESTQKDIIRDGLKLAGWDEEAIEEEIKDAEDLGKLETKSKMFLKKLQDAENTNKAELLERQEELRQNHIKEQQKYWDDLKSELTNKTEINGFPLTDKIKSQIWDHMSKPVDKKTGKTQLMINNENNKNAQYLYAYLDMLNWDISKLEKSVKTKVTSELRSKLGNFTDSRSKIAKQGKTETQEKEENPFAAFKGL